MNEKIKKGYTAFYQKYFVEQPELYQELTKGQNPHTFIVSCCDSRVDPEIMVQAEPGDIFVSRNIANIIPAPSESGAQYSEVIAAAEYAVKALNIKTLIICGHEACGGVHALATNGIKKVFDQSAAVFTQRQKELLGECEEQNYSEQARSGFEQKNVKMSVRNLLKYDFIQQSGVRVVGWHFSLTPG